MAGKDLPAEEGQPQSQQSSKENPITDAQIYKAAKSIIKQLKSPSSESAAVIAGLKARLATLADGGVNIG